MFICVASSLLVYFSSVVTISCCHFYTMQESFIFLRKAYIFKKCSGIFCCPVLYTTYWVVLFVSKAVSMLTFTFLGRPEHLHALKSYGVKWISFFLSVRCEPCIWLSANNVSFLLKKRRLLMASIKYLKFIRRCKLTYRKERRSSKNFCMYCK
jgi:hypothetical protein